MSGTSLVKFEEKMGVVDRRESRGLLGKLLMFGMFASDLLRTENPEKSMEMFNLSHGEMAPGVSNALDHAEREIEAFEKDIIYLTKKLETSERARAALYGEKLDIERENKVLREAVLRKVNYANDT